MKLSQLTKARIVAALPLVLMFGLAPTKSVALVVIPTLFAALMAPFLMLLIRCRRCDEFVIESVYKADGHPIPALFFTPNLRCAKCSVKLALVDPELE